MPAKPPFFCAYTGYLDSQGRAELELPPWLLAFNAVLELAAQDPQIQPGEAVSAWGPRRGVPPDQILVQGGLPEETGLRCRMRRTP